MDPVSFFKSLSDDTRFISTLLIKQQGELCVCELVEALELSQPKVSRHLAQLRQSGLLIDRRQEQWVFYSINPATPAWAINILEQASGAWQVPLNKYAAKLKRVNCRS